MALVLFEDGARSEAFICPPLSRFRLILKPCAAQYENHGRAIDGCFDAASFLVRLSRGLHYHSIASERQKAG
jgi:hypothetical protein